MVDELERLRRLRDEAPSPDASWTDDTRNELLAMADQEVREAEQPEAVAGSSPWERFLDGLAAAFRRPAVVAASALLVAAGGWGVYQVVQEDAGGPATLAQPSVEDQPGTPTGLELASRCTSSEGGYSVSYPGDWNTNPGETIPGCQVFDVEPLALEEGIGGGPLGAVSIRSIPVPVEAARDPGRGATLLSSEETTVAGRPAVRQVLEYTGETSIPEGVHAYRYLVALEGRSLLAITYDVGEPSFDRKREILDQMMRTIELQPGR